MRTSASYANTGSLGAYLAEGQQRERDYFSELYGRGKEWFIERPYKGLGALGAVLGGIAGLAFGPLGVLITGAVGAGVLGGLGAGYYWAWGRGKRIPKNTKFLDGRSLGKWYLDVLDAYKS